MTKAQATFSDYLSLVKFSHTVFALPFALLGFFLAVWNEGYAFEGRLLVLVVLCMVLARTSAMAFNRWADRNLDALNKRTKSREVPTGRIKSHSALLVAIISAALFVVTTYFINDVCFYLSPVALLVVLGYSYTKRFTVLSHFVLGLGLSLAPIGAYLAVSGEFALLPILISGAVLFWVTGFDVIYALQDVDFDRSRGLSSIPAYLGKRSALSVSLMLHFAAPLLLIAFGILAKFGALYWIGFGAFTVMLIYQHTIVSPNNLSRLNLAFFKANGVASVIFAAFSIAELWRLYDGAHISH